MATDEPTPPDLGNISAAQFLDLIDWDRQPVNIDGKDDTFETLNDCIVALLYRLIRDNIAYINEAFACRVSTPLGIAAKAAQAGTQHWKETDFPALALGNGSVGGVNPIPDLIFNGDGTPFDRNGVLKMNPPGAGTSITYAVVSAGTCIAEPGDDYPFVFGIRTHAERWVFMDSSDIPKAKLIAFQCSYALPEWPQDTVENIVLAKVANYLDPIDVGPNNRIGFEFGLGPAPSTDPNSNARDYVLYLKYYTAADVVQLVEATLPVSGDPAMFDSAEPISITPGRRITLGFERQKPNGFYEVVFYVNGVAITSPIGGLDEPSVSTSSDIRLHIGSAQLGKSYTGGPWNNASLWANPNSNLPASMKTLYLRGEGCEKVILA